MHNEQIDSASLHSLISALVCGRNRDWTNWERRAVAEVTLSLLFRANVTIPPPPKRVEKVYSTALVDHIFVILKDFISDARVSNQQRKEALSSTKSWVSKDPHKIREAFKLFKQDPSSEVFTRWAIERDWQYHVSRLGGLVDEPTIDEIATVLQWSAQEKKEVQRRSKEFELVKFWSNNYISSGELPPQDVVDGYLVSSLVRGRYYQALATKGFNYIWHPFRNYVLEPVVELTHFDLFNDRLVEIYLAGMICRGAMEEANDTEIIKTWAENIRRLRSRTLEIPREGNPDRAVKEAVKLARKCKLHIRWNRLDDILEGTKHYFVLPIAGIAAGMFTYLATGSHAASVLAHVTADNYVRPYADSVAAKIYNAATNSNSYLKKLAKAGTQRVFAITKDDLKDQKIE